MKAKDRKQLQAKNGIGMMAFKVNENTKENLDILHSTIQDGLNLKVSNSVLLRRCIELGFLNFLRILYEAKVEADGDDAENLRLVTEAFEKERNILIAHAEAE